MIKVLSITLLLMALALPAAAQPVQPSSVDRIRSSYGVWTGAQAETPCVASGTSGTITLNLSVSCSAPVGSPDVWQIGKIASLTGTTTIVFTNPTPGQTVRLWIWTNGQTVNLPSCIGPTPVTPTDVSFIAYDVIDSTPTYGCPAGVQAGLITAPVAVVQSQGFNASSGTGVATANFQITGFSAGDNATFIAGWCAINTCNTNNTVTVSSVTATGGSCVNYAAASVITSTATPMAVYRCTGISAGTVTFTINWSGNINWPIIQAFETSHDSGIEAGAVSSGNTTSAQPSATTGTLSQTNGELAVASTYTSAGQATAVTSPFVRVTASGINEAFIGTLPVTSCSSCSKTGAFTGATGTWTAVAFGLTHQ